MSTDKLQALHKALADAFAESPRISTHVESSHPVFDHEALSGIFGESPPISTNTRLARQNLDQEAFAEILRQPLPISTQTTPPHPAFDRESLAEIFDHPSTDPAGTKASPPSFDHPALAEILSEPQPVPIDPQLSPFSFDTGPTSAPHSGQLDNEGPAAKTVVAAPHTDAEDAPPQRAKSLLAKLHHIFSTKAEPPPSGIEMDPSSPSPSGQLREQEPVAKAIAFPTNDENGRPQQTTSRPTDPPPPGFERKSPPPRLAGQPGNQRPAVQTIAAPPADSANAQAQQARSSLIGPVPPSSINMEPSPPIFGEKRSRPVLLGRSDSLEPAAKADQPDNLEPTASAAPSDADSTGARHEWPSQTEPRLISISGETPSAAREKETSRPPLHSRSDNLEPAAETVAIALPASTENARPQRATSLLTAEAPATNPAKPPPLRMFAKEPPRLDPASRTVSVAPPPDTEGAVTRAQQARSLLAELDLNTAIRLRWVMRDIRSERTKLSPPSENDLVALVELGLVEMREGLPRLTALGVLALD